MFLEKYLQFPKRFRKIAEYLPNKTTGDVIAFYYLNKRALNLKKKLREHRTLSCDFNFILFFFVLWRLCNVELIASAVASSRRRSSAGRTEYVLVPREQTAKQRVAAGLPRELANLGVSAEFWGAGGANVVQGRTRPTFNSRAARLPADESSDRVWWLI